MSIVKGEPTSGSGGGIDNLGGELAITDCVFNENIVLGSGGAIENDHGSLNIVPTTFFSNQDDYGGAIDNHQGSLTITKSYFYSLQKQRLLPGHLADHRWDRVLLICAAGHSIGFILPESVQLRHA